MAQKTHLGDNLKFLREKNVLTKTDIAKIIGVNRSGQIHNYETGFCEPNITLLVNISSFFNVTIDDLIKKDLTKK